MHYKILLFVIAITLFAMTSKAEQRDNIEKSSKLTLSVKLSYINSDSIKKVKVSITRKADGKKVRVNGVNVSLYFSEVSKNNLIDSLVTNEMGEALFLIPDKFNKMSLVGQETTFKVRINNKLYEETEEEITIKDAILSLSFMEKDSTKTVSAKFYRRLGDMNEVPIPEIGIKFYVKTTFSLLPIGAELSTDENGMAITELPLDLPADYQKTMIVVARVENNEDYGTLESHLVIPWHVLPKTVTNDKRTLWSSGRNAPVPLVIVSISIIISVWSVVLYLIFQLFKVWKLGRPLEKTKR